ncbi:MOSC domain-containing protein [Wenxinia saemankumensis]|uniref:MOSC domain-containing protein n=1 Tax=Wenxinia saemankumensis TaxID=1447782 RepID=A0A1M6BZQ7_9RHOB|nr:MOSC domain-containing protein [Wenxinia saemankumensis]SHI54275.1 hypothetical protein SAMN05444417_0933 [Wenxinia saemankumensis]
MPALVPTDHAARITWLGVSPNPEGEGDIRSVHRQSLRLTFAGPEGEVRHGGLTRPSCSRVTAQHPKGTTIANVRQLSLMSGEEIAAIAAGIGLDALDPALLGATLVLEGLPDFSHLPPSARLQGPDGATLVVDMQNRPCNLPAREIERAAPGHGKAFKAAAKGRRGVTAWVEREGVLSLGDTLRLHLPDQRAWRPV